MTGQYGYAGRILKVDLSSGAVTHLATADYIDRFPGGRGVAAKIYWDEVLPSPRMGLCHRPADQDEAQGVGLGRCGR